MSGYQPHVDAVKAALLLADQCERFQPEEGEPCDGFPYCDACLTLAAASIVDDCRIGVFSR